MTNPLLTPPNNARLIFLHEPPHTLHFKPSQRNLLQLQKVIPSSSRQIELLTTLRIFSN